MSNPLKIIKLKAENIKRIKAVEINPSDNTVIISGENGQGKSSVLDAIWLALNVSEANKEISTPIRNGEDKAKSVIDLGDIKVTRTWTSKGTYLKVEPKEIVSKYGGAQSVLDAFIGKLSFDPMEFIKLPDKEQREMLLKLVDIGIDLDAWEVKKKQTYDERTDVNRQVKEYKIKVDNVPAIPDNTLDEEVNIQDAIAELQTQKDLKDAYDKSITRQTEIKIEIQNLQTELDYSKVYTDKIEHEGLPDIAAKQEYINNIQKINENVRTLQQYNSDKLAFETHQNNADTLNSRLEQMEDQKQDAIKSANFPISGLGFSDSGVIYNDIPISQIATSEQIKVSMSIAMALNPNLRVIIIKEGSLLDYKNLELVKQMVKDKGYQLWIECVDDTGKLGIVIEDGQVKSDEKVNFDNVHAGPVPSNEGIQPDLTSDNTGELRKHGGWF